MKSPKKIRKTIFILIGFVIVLNSFSQTENVPVCKKMNKVKVNYSYKMNEDSLKIIQEVMLKKGIKINYNKYIFDKTGELSYIDLYVECSGCKMQGTLVLEKRALKSKDKKYGFYFNHLNTKGGPKFKIGEITGL